MKACWVWILPGAGLVVSGLGVDRLGAAEEQLRFAGIERLANGETALQLAAPQGVFCRIDVSADLTRWEGFLTLASTGVNGHTDSATPYFGQRYYRAEQLSGTNHVTGDHLATDNGDLIIHPLFHATFVMSWNGMMIYVDPDDTARYGGLPPADLMLVTHAHSDHWNAGTIEAVRRPETVIIAPQSVYNSFSTSLRALTQVVAEGSSISALGVGIEAVPAYNANHPKGQGVGYVLNVGGARLYISGDTGDAPEVRALRDIDVAFLCMNVPYTMTVNQAASVVREVRPKVVYPYHYRNQDGSFADLTSFKQQVSTDLGIEVRLRNWY